MYARITHIIQGGQYGIENGYVVLSIKNIDEAEFNNADGEYRDYLCKTHNLKLHRKFADAVEFGHKKAEVRRNDRDFQVGDLIEFNIVDE